MTCLGCAQGILQTMALLSCFRDSILTDMMIRKTYFCLFKTLIIFTALPSLGAYISWNEGQVTDHYSGVQEWTNFSAKYDISRECSTDHPVRVAYFTRHEGTIWDFAAVATSVGIPWTVVNPAKFHPIFQTNETDYNDYDSAHRTFKAIGQMFCHVGDILMFGDVNSYARPALEFGCNTPVIIQTTNRFKVCVRGPVIPVFETLIKQAVTWPHVWWIMNNPYEEIYYNLRQIQLPKERTLMLRPVGVSMLPRPAPSVDLAALKTNKMAVVHDVEFVTSLDSQVLVPWVNNENLLDFVSILPKRYGGPYVLSSFKAIVHFPYQVSVMKMYEGLAVGAAFVIPTPPFFKELFFKHDDPTQRSGFCCKEMLETYPDTFAQYMDWYHDDFKDCMIYFSSMEELKQIIRGEKYGPQVFEDKRLLGMQAMKRVRAHTLAGYKQLFMDIKKKACEDNGKPDVFSPGMGTRVYRSMSQV